MVHKTSPMPVFSMAQKKSPKPLCKKLHRQLNYANEWGWGCGGHFLTGNKNRGGGYISSNIDNKHTQVIYDRTVSTSLTQCLQVLFTNTITPKTCPGLFI